SLAKLGHVQDERNVELIPPSKNRSNRSDIIYLPHGYKEVEGPAERGPQGPFLPGVIAPLPRPTPPVAHAERLWPAWLGQQIEVSTPSIADGQHPRYHSTRSLADPG